MHYPFFGKIADIPKYFEDWMTRGLDPTLWKTAIIY